jgi:hypothetical protein
MNTKDFKAGDQVKILPHTDQFMMGMTHGTVTLVGRKFVTIRVTSQAGHGRKLKCHPEHIEVAS